jgi:fructokinase
MIMIISCGEALVDVVPTDRESEAIPGGGPMNVAIAATRLGVSAAFLGCVSSDPYGRKIWDHLTANGVDTRICQRSDAPTARAIVEHVPQLVFRFEGVDTADTQLEPPNLALLGTGPHIVHGGTLGLFRGQTAETLADLVEVHDGIVSLDPNIRPQIIDDRERWHHFHQRWLAHTNIYKGSDEDLQWIWPDRSPDSSAEALLATDVDVVVLTRGGDGLSIITADGESRAAAPDVDVVDTVGAGDTIVAAVLASLLEAGVHQTAELRAVTGSEWAEISRRAAAAAAITCSRAGADPPRRSELAW